MIKEAIPPLEVLNWGRFPKGGLYVHPVGSHVASEVHPYQQYGVPSLPRPRASWLGNDDVIHMVGHVWWYGANTEQLCEWFGCVLWLWAHSLLSALGCWYAVLILVFPGCDSQSTHPF